jgi:hypothetical protein
MSKYLSMTSVRGSMKVLTECNIQDICLSLGCTEQDWHLVRGSKPWLGKDRPRVVRLLEGCFYGMIDTLGTPRFEVPAEFIAGVLTLIAHPVNFWTASAWLGTQKASEDIINDTVDGCEDVTPRQIFSLCLEAYSDEICGQVMANFNAKVTMKLNEQNELLLQQQKKQQTRK